MAFSKKQYEEIKTLVGSGEIDEARRLLEDIDDDNARSLLGKLNEKYPLTLSDAKRLLGQQRYEEAEKVLWNLDDPEATMLLEKLTVVKNKMKPVSGPARSASQAAPPTGGLPFTVPPRASVSLKMNPRAGTVPRRPVSLSTIVTVVGMVILVILLLVLADVVQQRQRPEIIRASLKEVCIKLSRVSPEPGDENLTAEQIAANCAAAVEHLYEESPAVVNSCYDLVGDKNDALEWSACLSDKLPDLPSQPEGQNF